MISVLLSLILTVAWAEKPNIVMIMVDDLALMDFGCYGGEARTPHIDQLARAGARFTQYRTSPLCSPSRAMFLTGRDNHRTGMATIPECLPAEHSGQRGYSMRLEPGVRTVADHLQAAGYRTLMTGKWHLGSNGVDDLPCGHGFNRSFALDASGADNYEDKSYMPYYRDAPWYEDGQRVPLFAKRSEDQGKNHYSSEFIVDKMIEYIDDSSEADPFLAFVSFQALHIPVQAPAEFTSHYNGVYDSGWHVLRDSRFERAKELGLVPSSAELLPLDKSARDWSSLSVSDRTLYAARMEVVAGMIEAMDYHIGRLMDHLRARGLFDNTVFVVSSDNGPEPSRGDDDLGLALWMRLYDYHIGKEHIGERGSWVFTGPEWASARASPSALFKFYTAEGGVRVPLIVSGPGVRAGRTINSTALVTDVTPTVLALAGVPSDPDCDGRSLASVLSGTAEFTWATDEPIGIEVAGNSALYKGDFKAVRNFAPFGDGEWRLYNIKEDPGETHNLAQSHSALLDQLRADYDAYATRVGVLEFPPGIDAEYQLWRNLRTRFLINTFEAIQEYFSSLLAIFF